MNRNFSTFPFHNGAKTFLELLLNSDYDKYYEDIFSKILVSECLLIKCKFNKSNKNGPIVTSVAVRVKDNDIGIYFIYLV